MHHLFTAEGDAAVAAVLSHAPLLAFDFDGTLAPIVPRPQDARISQAVAMRLRALAMHFPVAIVTGRTIDDVRSRLGFEPHFVMGNHGAEDDADPDALAALSSKLDPLRERLRLRELEVNAAGIFVEDKGPSIALHYRLARERGQALALIHDFLSVSTDTFRIFAGKMVVNVMPANAPDKADAVLALVQRSGSGAAFFAGDDVNDEPVFEAAADNWLTVRVGRDDRSSAARFFLDGPNEMAMLLERMLVLLT